MRELTCCGKRVTGATVTGVIVGVCRTCGRVVARINPQTGDTEKVDDNDAWSDRPREVLMSRKEFRARKRLGRYP
jgi:hypothetical protein